MLKLSIIIPVYNVASVLPETLNSVLRQTYSAFELILVDDGSSDGSGGICDAYAAKDTRIRVIHQDNSGVSVARNVGVSNAKGEYIGFVDSDDVIEPDMYEILLSLAKTYNAQVVQCQHDRSQMRNHSPRSQEIKLLSGPDFVRRIFTMQSAQYTNQVSLCTKIIHRDLFSYIHFPEGRVYEDEQETYKACLHAERIAETPDILYHYVYRQNSIITGVSAKKMLQKQLALLDRLNYLPEILPEMAQDCLRSFVQYSEVILCAMYSADEQKSVEQAVAVLLRERKRVRSVLNVYEKIYLPVLRCKPLRNVVLKYEFAPIQNVIAKLRRINKKGQNDE